MKKKYIYYELVPVEVAKKILERESSPAKRKGKRKPVIKKPRRAAKGLRTVPKKVEVLTL